MRSIYIHTCIHIYIYSILDEFLWPVMVGQGSARSIGHVVGFALCLTMKRERERERVRERERERERMRASENTSQERGVSVAEGI